MKSKSALLALSAFVFTLAAARFDALAMPPINITNVCAADGPTQCLRIARHDKYIWWDHSNQSIADWACAPQAVQSFRVLNNMPRTNNRVIQVICALPPQVRFSMCIGDNAACNYHPSAYYVDFSCSYADHQVQASAELCRPYRPADGQPIIADRGGGGHCGYTRWIVICVPQ